MIAFKQDNLWGYLNTNGKVAIEPIFKNVKPFNNGIAIVQQEIIRQKTVFIKSWTNPQKKETKETLWGYINEQGEYIISPRFYEAHPFIHGLAKVITNDNSNFCDNLYTLIDITGFPITTKKYNGLRFLSNGYWLGATGKHRVGSDNCFFDLSFLDANGNFVKNINSITTPEGKRVSLNYLDDFENGVIKVSESQYYKKTYFLNEKLEYIFELPVRIKDISKNLGGFYVFIQNEKFGIISQKGELLHKPIIEEIKDLELTIDKKNANFKHPFSSTR